MTSEDIERWARSNGRNWAYPTSEECDGGLSIREWLVGQVLAGIGPIQVATRADVAEVADLAVRMADAVLVRLAQPQGGQSRCAICGGRYSGPECPVCADQGADLGADDPTGEPSQDPTPGDERLIPRPGGTMLPGMRPPRPDGRGEA